jgi:hypothetical protein
MSKIVHIHIPKCGGTSFNLTLNNEFGSSISNCSHGISRDVNNLITKFTNFNNSINVDYYDNVKLIHGHVLPIRYYKLYERGWRFITWLREPIQRLISDYYHIKRNKNNFINEINGHIEILPEKKGTFGEKILLEKMTLDDFLLDGMTKNYYQRFFYNFPPENYFFIGIVENYQSDLKYLSYLLGINLNMNNENINPNKKDNLYKIDPDLMKKIKEFHSEDYDLYYKMLEESNKRK